jgi:GT2 family glycosyltransferase
VSSEQERAPGVSVVVRSFRRLPALFELLEAILAQDYEDFEVVVIEQSGVEAKPFEDRFQALSAKHPKLRVIRTEPLGPAGARNRGWRAASKEIVLFMDDDDLPMGATWIAAHAVNYLDPEIVGVSGSEVLEPGERMPYVSRWLARHFCLSYSFLGTPYTFCRFDERVERVDWLHGGNASIRRSIVEELGGWDAEFVDHEEHSLCVRLRPLRKTHRLVFDPNAKMLRRKNIEGGIGRRGASLHDSFRQDVQYYHRVAKALLGWRFCLLLPLYPPLIWLRAARRVVGEGSVRLGAELLHISATFPWAYRKALTDGSQ